MTENPCTLLQQLLNLRHLSCTVKGERVNLQRCPSDGKRTGNVSALAELGAVSVVFVVQCDPWCRNIHRSECRSRREKGRGRTGKEGSNSMEGQATASISRL